MTPREQFNACLRKLESLKAFQSLVFNGQYPKDGKRQHALFVRYAKECESAWAKVNPTKGKKPKTWMCDECIKPVTEHFSNMAKTMQERAVAAKRKHEDTMFFLAKEIQLWPGEEWTKAYTASASTYSSQPGCQAYARGDAERKAIHYRTCGLEAEVRGLEVWVKAEALEIQIAEHKPGVPLKEFVRLCWKMGNNPRVVMPMLPHGYEEQNGLDYFGNELPSDPEARKEEKYLRREDFILDRFYGHRVYDRNKGERLHQRQDISRHLRWLRNNYGRKRAKACLRSLVSLGLKPISEARMYWIYKNS